MQKAKCAEERKGRSRRGGIFNWQCCWVKDSKNQSRLAQLDETRKADLVETSSPAQAAAKLVSEGAGENGTQFIETDRNYRIRTEQEREGQQCQWTDTMKNEKCAATA